MLRFGFIGCGNAARHHADVVKALGHQIYAVSARVSSPNIDSFGRDYSVSRKFSDWREMLVHGKLDALLMATSWEQTELIAKDVIQAGVPVLIEKPLALSSVKVKEILSDTKCLTSGDGHKPYKLMPSRAAEKRASACSIKAADDAACASWISTPRRRSIQIAFFKICDCS